MSHHKNFSLYLLLPFLTNRKLCSILQNDSIMMHYIDIRSVYQIRLMNPNKCTCHGFQLSFYIVQLVIEYITFLISICVYMYCSIITLKIHDIIKIYPMMNLIIGICIILFFIFQSLICNHEEFSKQLQVVNWFS